MTSFSQLVSGFRTFKATGYEERHDLIQHLIRQGQKPSTLMIASCTLRVSPDILFGCNPGDLFVLRNLGGLIPPNDSSESHGMIGTVDYAVDILEVENIVVLGNARSECVHALLAGEEQWGRYSESLKTWLKIAEPAAKAVREQMAEKSEEEQRLALEQELVILSLKNLLSYPSVKERIDKGKLNLFGWHFDIEHGFLTGFNPETASFEPLN